MIYKASEISNYILSYANLNKKLISNFKLQSLLYFIQVHYLSTKGFPCFEDEIIMSEIGPIIPEIYDKYSIYNGASIYQERTNYHIEMIDKIKINEALEFLIQYPANVLKNISLNQLPCLSTPTGQEITHNKIIAYFKEEATNEKE